MRFVSRAAGRRNLAVTIRVAVLFGGHFLFQLGEFCLMQLVVLFSLFYSSILEPVELEKTKLSDSKVLQIRYCVLYLILRNEKIYI